MFGRCEVAVFAGFCVRQAACVHRCRFRGLFCDGICETVCCCCSVAFILIHAVTICNIAAFAFAVVAYNSITCGVFAFHVSCIVCDVFGVA